MNKKQVTTSKFLSQVLRHRPEAIGVTLDAEGWIAIDRLLAACSRHGKAVSREELDEVVRANDKRRFAFSADGLRIRANQGHSIAVDLGLVPVEPPELLFHGTVARFLPSIRREGLVRGKRHHVHLSPDAETARRVGGRRGRPVVRSFWSSRRGGCGAMATRSIVRRTTSGLPNRWLPITFVSRKRKPSECSAARELEEYGPRVLQ